MELMEEVEVYWGVITDRIPIEQITTFKEYIRDVHITRDWKVVIVFYGTDKEIAEKIYTFANKVNGRTCYVLYSKEKPFDKIIVLNRDASISYTTDYRICAIYSDEVQIITLPVELAMIYNGYLHLHIIHYNMCGNSHKISLTDLRKLL